MRLPQRKCPEQCIVDSNASTVEHVTTAKRRALRSGRTCLGSPLGAQHPLREIPEQLLLPRMILSSQPGPHPVPWKGQLLGSGPVTSQGPLAYRCTPLTPYLREKMRCSLPLGSKRAHHATLSGGLRRGALHRSLRQVRLTVRCVRLRITMRNDSGSELG